MNNVISLEFIQAKKITGKVYVIRGWFFFNLSTWFLHLWPEWGSKFRCHKVGSSAQRLLQLDVFDLSDVLEFPERQHLNSRTEHHFSSLSIYICMLFYIDKFKVIRSIDNNKKLNVINDKSVCGVVSRVKVFFLHRIMLVSSISVNVNGIFLFS